MRRYTRRTSPGWDPTSYPMGFIDRQGEFAAPVGQAWPRKPGGARWRTSTSMRDAPIAESRSTARSSPAGSSADGRRRAWARDLPVAGTHTRLLSQLGKPSRRAFSEITHVNQLLLAFLGGADAGYPRPRALPGTWGCAPAELDHRTVRRGR
jgi:hypothetical protein